MGSMAERPEGSGRWRLRVHVGDRQYTTGTFTGSKREAAKVLARLEVTVDQRRAPKPSRESVGALLEDWWESKAWDSIGARREARGSLDRYLIPELGEIRLSKLTDRHIAILYNGLRDGTLAKRNRPLTAATVRRLHNDLHSALNWAVKKGRLGRNPASVVDAPSVPATTVRGPDTDELRALLRIADGGEKDFAVFVRIAAATGRRREDVLGLTMADLRIEERALIFDKRVVLAGKGAGVAVESLDKNYRTARVDVDDVTMGRVVVLVAERQARAALVGGLWGRRAYLFSDDITGASPWRPDSTSREFRQLRERAGLDGVTLHGLRHAHITELLEGGLDVEAVAKRVGDNPATIYRVYAHARRTSDRRAAAIMGRALDGAEPRLIALEGGAS